MNTPNFWLPNAPLSTPAQPNVILMCNYEGCPTAEQLEAGAPVHVTMFGSVKALDMRRKWSIWQIVAPYAGICLDGQTGYSTPFLCNGTGTGKIYRLISSDIQMTDDGTPIQPLYTTSSLPGAEKSLTLQLGSGQKYAAKWMANLAGSSAANGLEIVHYQNLLPPVWSATQVYAAGITVAYQGALWLGVSPITGTPPAAPQWVPSSLAVDAPYVPPLTPAMANNVEWGAEVRGQRIFVEFSMNQYGTSNPGYFEIGELMAEFIPHPWGSFRGVSQ
jgi:hypothetical protein